MKNVKDVVSEQKKVEKEKPLKDTDRADHVTDSSVLEETIRGYRVVYFNKAHVLHRVFGIDSIRIYDKSLLKVSKYGDQEYTKERNRLLLEGSYLTYHEQMSILKEKNIWSEDHEARLKDMRSEVNEMIEQQNEIIESIEIAEKAKDKKEVANLKEQLADLSKRMVELHNALLELSSIQLTYFRDTIENRAQVVQQMGWVVSSVCRNEGDDRYNPEMQLWSDIDALEADLKDNDFGMLLNECASFWMDGGGASESFFGESPDELTLDSDGEQPKS